MYTHIPYNGCVLYFIAVYSKSLHYLMDTAKIVSGWFIILSQLIPRITKGHVHNVIRGKRGIYDERPQVWGRMRCDHLVWGGAYIGYLLICYQRPV